MNQHEPRLPTTERIEQRDERTASPSENEGPDGNDEPGRGLGTLLRGTAAGLIGLAGIGALGGAATAAGSGDRLLVFGEGIGGHEYEIGMKSGGSIWKAAHAGSNDSVGTNARGNRRITGEVWHFNADSYRFSGEIAYVRGAGNVAFHVPDGALRSANNMDIDGQERGDHWYAVASNTADIELVPGTTESLDTDHSIGKEATHTADRISGKLVDTGHDSITVGSGDPVQCLTVQSGHVRFSR